MQNLYSLLPFPSWNRAGQVLQGARSDDETQLEGSSRTEDCRDSSGTQVEGGAEPQGEIHHERCAGRPSDRRHMGGRSVRARRGRERLCGPRRRDRRPDRRASSPIRDPSCEGPVGPPHPHQLHGRDLRACPGPRGAHGRHRATRPHEVDLPELGLRGHRECGEGRSRGDEESMARVLQDRLPRSHFARHQPHGEGKAVSGGFRPPHPGGPPRRLRLPVSRSSRAGSRGRRKGPGRGIGAAHQPARGRGPRRGDPRRTGPGRGGMIVPPKEFFPLLRRLCDQYGIVLIDDEVQAGAGRTGKMWAIENWSTVPDVLVSGKAIGGGLPFGGVTGKPAVMDAPGPGGLGGTFGGTPVVCAAALEAVDEIEQALPGTKRLEARTRQRLDEMAEGHERIGEARGIGAMWALVFVKDPRTKEPDVDLARSVQTAGLKNGLILLTAGFYNNCIRLLPPINIPLPLMDTALDLLADSLDMAVAGKGR